MMKKRIHLSLSVVLLISCLSAGAMETMPLVYDLYVNKDSPTAVYSDLATLRLEAEGTGIDLDNLTNIAIEGSIHRIFLQFDLSSLPDNAILTGAEFGIYLSDIYDLDVSSIQLWDVKNHQWDNDLNWDNSLTLLGNKEAIGISQSYGTGDVDDYIRWTLGDFVDWDFAGALADQTASFMLTLAPEDIFNFAVFNSSDNAANHPYFKVSYIPEPATLVLLGLGGVLLRKRKR